MTKKRIDKERLDLRLVDLSLADSRNKASALIMAGKVLVDDQPSTKPGQMVKVTSKIRLRDEGQLYVSRGGFKLRHALEIFAIQIDGKTGMDVGASTGGFTQVLLLGGIKKVFALDVGINQLAWSLRNDSRVISKEKINVRHIQFDDIGELVDIITIDVSFISLEKIMPSLLQFSHFRTDWITLIKPQFEVGRDMVGKGGIVTSDSAQRSCVERITHFATKIGLRRLSLTESPILGSKGNREFLAHWKKN